MFDTSFRLADMTATTVTSHHGSQGQHAIIVQSSLALFQQASRRGWMRRAWFAVTRRSCSMMVLSTLGAKPYAQHDGGRQTVAIDKIIGSENRVGDFDDQFHPLRSQSKERWMSVAGACFQGIPLPPVVLIQVGDRYFVRDGHHRISVARTLGQVFIDADVTVFQVAGLLPWETPAQGAGGAWQAAPADAMGGTL